MAPDRLAVGAKAGPWRVEGELGRGGMGAVYAVVHHEIGKRAALKLMHRRLGEEQAERMLVEARVVNQCQHPNIVDVFETGTLGDGRPYLVMERLDGLPLSARVALSKVLPDRAIDILRQVAEALIAAHRVGVVHRDLKPDNIFLVDDSDARPPRVKLLDWGIAKEIANDVRQTLEGQLVGTPQYLSPEQARGQLVSPQSDVYSLGVVAFELFLEQLPFEAETPTEVMAMHIRATPPVPSELWPDIPGELEDLLLAMLEKDPSRRPTMTQVVERLDQVRSLFDSRRVIRRSDTVSAPIAPLRALQWSETQLLTPIRKRWWPYAAGALATAVVVLLLFVRSDTSQAAVLVPPAPAAIQQVAKPLPAVLVAHLAPVIVTAPVSPPVAAAPTTPPPPAAAPRTRVRKVARTKPIDPNGTIDAYR